MGVSGSKIHAIDSKHTCVCCGPLHSNLQITTEDGTNHCGLNFEPGRKEGEVLQQMANKMACSEYRAHLKSYEWSGWRWKAHIC